MIRRRKAPNGAPLAFIREHVDHDGDGCLTWPFSCLENGYPAVVWPVKGAKVGVLACRYMCELAHGPSPVGDYDASHSCGRGKMACIHPNHLSWKTPQQNVDDRRAHGTNTVGVRHPNAKLDDRKVRAIRKSQADLQTLSKRFGVSAAAISMARSGRTWGHI